jgi:dihydrofolate reductase
MCANAPVSTAAVSGSPRCSASKPATRAASAIPGHVPNRADKDVGVGAASIVQQCIKGGLLDEIHLDLVHVLLGDGVSLFDHLGTGPIDLESTRVIEGAGVTHLTYRVIK